MKGILKYPLLICFCAFISILSVLDLIKPDKDFSEFENKFLKQRPKFTVSALLGGSYTMDYETYINEQFILRDNWITTKSISESALMKIENNGIVYGKDGQMFEKFQALPNDQLTNNIGFIAQFLEMYPQQKVTVAIAPSAYTILADKVPTGLGNVDQQSEIERIFKGIAGSDNHSKISFIPALQGHADEYIYYRTDHHWTTKGAFYAYSQYVASKGLTPVSMEEIAPLAREVWDFHGTYYNKAKPYNAVPDTITYYDIDASKVLINGEEKDGYYDAEKWAERDKYAAFLRGNNGFTMLESAVNKGHIAGKTSKILVIKDSYANSFVPFLMYNYDEVHVMDLRDSHHKLTEILAENEYDEILLMYNFMNLVSDTNIYKLRY